jgi:hypothetical protein
MTFDEWWNERWHSNTWTTGVMELAFKEIAKTAWDAAIDSYKRESNSSDKG